MKKRILSVILGISLAFTVVGCGAKNNAGNNTTTDDTKEESKLEGTVAVIGSTTVQPVAQAIADEFANVETGIKVDVQGVGSSAGVKAANEGTADIGMASRELKTKEEEWGLDKHIIAYDGIAVIFNSTNEVTDLTKDQVTKIFKGEITNWKEVGGADAEILVVSREAGSGTRGAFEELTDLDGADGSLVTEEAEIKDGNGAVRAFVAGDENSIGYISLGYIDDTVKPAVIDGVEATVENIKAGDYSIFRPLLMITKGELSAETKVYLDFVLGAEGQAIVAKKYIPVTE
ncbi:phosphate ABC transporter substrate-binding protein [Clostridium sediminicola]|uniref:phosphate ABC transporter substrate-binding protein n=1 Tax=Clostridium sediminicola TaxID=3114879 RepID=UPI0031F2187C